MDSLAVNRTINIPMPSRCDVLVYFSESRVRWITSVHFWAINVDDPEARTQHYSSQWEHPAEPTTEQIREHVVAFLDHEVQHWLGMDPHGTKRPPVARVVIQPRVHVGDLAGHTTEGES